MSDSEVRLEFVGRLGEEFIERFRRGERPALTEYTARFPEHADEIRELFPALAVMENLAPADQESLGLPESLPRRRAEPPLLQLGDYRIIREVGRGGMGVVYEAEQVSLGRHVALKVLSSPLLRDGKVRQRFEREARAAARLHHTNIVPVFGVGENNGTLYYAMQFIQGLALDDVLVELRRLKADAPGSQLAAEMRIVKQSGSLAADVARSLMTGRFAVTEAIAEEAAQGDEQPADRKVLTEHALPVTEVDVHSSMARCSPATASGRNSDTLRLTSNSAVLPGVSEASSSGKLRRQTYWHSVARIGVQVASALQYAHDQGVLHRDIKPGNLMLDLRGTVWVTDFGLAKAADCHDLTEQGDILGTLRYMPPEAFEGKADAGGDVYSLGLTLYELLAFQPAFREKDRHKLIKLVTTTEPTRIEKLNRDVPRDLATIVHKAIDRDPAHRYRTVREMADDLQRFIGDEPVQARRSSTAERTWRWCRRNPALAGALAAAVAMFLVGFAGVTWKWLEAERNEAIAVRAKKDAEEARAKADDRAEDLQRGLYFQSIARADLEYASSNIGRADQILDACPAKYRHWEWHYLKRLCHSELLALKGHTDAARSVAFSPDGRLLASAGHDGTIRIWELPSGREVHVLRGHESTTILSVVFSPDSRLLASVSGNWTEAKPGELKLWDALSGEERFAKRPHRTAISEVAFTPDGRRLVTAGWDSTVQIHDADNGAVVKVLRSKAKVTACKCLAVSPDGGLIAAGYHQPAILLWDAETGQELGELSGPGGHKSDVTGLAFSPDGKQLVSGGWDATVKLWNLSTRQVERSFEEHSGVISRVTFSPDGQCIASASHDGTVRFCNKQGGRALWVIRGHSREVHCVAYSPGGACVATAGWDQTVKVWDATSSQVSQTLRTGVNTWIKAFAFSPDGRLIAAASATQPSGHSNYVFVWDSSSRNLLKRFGERKGELHTVAFSPDSKRLATDWGNDVKVWDPQTEAETATFEGHTAPVTGVAFSPDRRYLASASEDGTVLLWDWTASERMAVGVLRGHELPVTCLAFLPDGSLVTGGADRTVRVWDVASRKTLLVFRGHTGEVTCVACSPDGRWVVSACADSTSRIWNADTGQELRALSGHVGRVRSVAFSHDGLRLATAGEDGQIAVWNAATGEEALTLRRQTRDVKTVAFSPGDRSLAASSVNLAVTLWDGATTTEESRSRRLLAWHEAESRDLLKLGRFQPALHHLTMLIEADRYSGARWLDRGNCHAELGQWENAAADFAKAVELQPDNVHNWCRQAVCLLGAERMDEYRRVRAAMITRFASDKDGSVRGNVAYICVPVADSADDPAALLALADRGGTRIFGAALYRAGQYESAIKTLGPDPTRAWDCLFVAMAYHRLNRADQSRAALKKATQWIDEADRRAPNDPQDMDRRWFSWNERVEVGYLRREAEALIMRE